jgi:CRISPR-associated protein Cas4
MLKELIDQFYTDGFRDRDRTGKFYITDAGKCPRAIFFKFKKYPYKEPEARILRIFDHGDYTHMRLMSVLFSLGIVRAAEIKIPPQEIISGRVDAIIGFEGKPYVLEIKSSSRYRFAKLTEPDPDHQKQLQLYLHYFKIPQGIFIYEDKDSQNLKEFIVEYNPELVEKILKELEILKEQIKHNTIPSIPKDIEPWRCEYCEYQEECQKIEGSRPLKDRSQNTKIKILNPA